MRPIFIVRLVLRFLEAMQSRQCFLEVRLAPCRHRVEIRHVRANPPVATVDVDFCFGGNMTLVFACKPIHLEDDLFRATQLDHRFSEELVADESVRGCCHISFCGISFEVDLPCGTLCNQDSPATCDRVAGRFLM